MKSFEFHNSYNPQSCPKNSSHMAATLGAGAQDDETFQALAKHNAVTVGGTYKTVGIVGWSTGGGHGWLTSEYGQGADNIFEVEMVLPNGAIVVANECQNKEIFWAIRGGGGGTFGVITKITMKAYPMPQTTQWLWGVSQSNGTSAQDWWRSVAELHSTMVGVSEQGFQGYYTIIKSASGLMEMGGYFLAYDKSEEKITQILQPFLEQVNSTNQIDYTRSIVTRYNTWIEAYNSLPEQSSTDSSSGPGGVISITRLLTKKGLTDDIKASAKMFEAIGPQDDDAKVRTNRIKSLYIFANKHRLKNGISSHILAGALVASSKPVDNALNPAWRDTAVHMIVKKSWSTNLTQERVEELQDNATNRTGYAMRQLSPDSGCYVNEVRL
ncbi:hypothetical protein N0V95_003351 [Ascochyta clinopodiicola]|nr:hypothetical protein N0V95_003351 [Ascochyta clinopodiicola]